MLISSGCAGRGSDVGRLDEFCKVRNKGRRGEYLLEQIGKMANGQRRHSSYSSLADQQLLHTGVGIQLLPAQQSVGHKWRKENSGENMINLTN